ncbi:MAG: hypothetical protein EXR72_17515 [Myxococcales bacterium]|nr:hypothetical protein [Myxococcales bacterium]
MGMFDHVTIISDIRDDDRLGFQCPSGHRLERFQTKSFDPGMDQYYVRAGRLFRLAPSRDQSTERVTYIAASPEKLIVHHEQEALFLPQTGEVLLYTPCGGCRPVLSLAEGSRSVFGDMVQEHAIFCEFAATFQVGVLTAVERREGTTRDALKEKLQKHGVEILDDDERLARRHFELRERPGRRGWSIGPTAP